MPPEPTDVPVTTRVLPPAADVPNNPALALLLYAGALPVTDPEDTAARCEALFDAHDWPAAWRGGVIPYHHYHSTAHEALGLCRSWVRVQFGGADGPVLEANAGDVIVIPAGVAHKRIAAGDDLLIVGAYPRGQRPDMCRADADTLASAAERVRAVPPPAADPVHGSAGPLLEHWPARA